MVYVDTKWFCDACGKEIKGYKGRIELNCDVNSIYTLDEIVESKGLDFCAECMKSFNDWKRSRMS